MKKLSLSILTMFSLLLLSPAQLIAGVDKNTVSTTVSTTAKSVEANAMVVRLNEIKAMDMTTLNKSEKKELRKEVRTINSELKTNNEGTYIEGGRGGVYVSVGAAILIVLLLVLLL